MKILKIINWLSYDISIQIKNLMYDYDYLVRLIVIGDVSVGKSALVDRWVDQKCNPEPYSTIGIDFRITSRTINDKKFRIQIYDTSGQERFFAITKSYYRSADGIILVYDMNNPNSVQNLYNWYNRVRDICDDKIPIFVIGNKIDLNNWIPPISLELPQFQVSAMSGCKMEETLEQILNQLTQRISDSPVIPLDFIPNSQSKSCCNI